MNKRIISSPAAPKAVGPYNQAVEINGFLYVSGQLPIDVATGDSVPGGVKEQCIQVFKNIVYILNESGYGFENVVKTTVYLTDMADFLTMNEVYATFFKEPFPARVAFAVKGLPKGGLVEADVVAAK